MIKEPNGDKKEIVNCCEECKEKIKSAYGGIGDQTFSYLIEEVKKCCPDYKLKEDYEVLKYNSINDTWVNQ